MIGKDKIASPKSVNINLTPMFVLWLYKKFFYDSDYHEIFLFTAERFQPSIYNRCLFREAVYLSTDTTPKNVTLVDDEEGVVQGDTVDAASEEQARTPSEGDGKEDDDDDTEEGRDEVSFAWYNWG